VTGSVLLFLLPFFLAPIVGHHQVLVFGLLVLGAILAAPKGLVGFLDSSKRAS